MSSLNGVSKNSKTSNWLRSVLVVASGCLLSVNGFAQLIYLGDIRSVTGSASVTDVSQYNSAPYYTTSYTGDFSGTSSPTPFADFNGSVEGTATFQGGLNLSGGELPMTISSSVTSTQVSFLHPQELYFSSFASVFGLPFPGSGEPSGQWAGEGSSSLQVTFMVTSPVDYNLMVAGTGDPVAAGAAYNLTSSTEGSLVNGNTAIMLQHGEYGVHLDYSGTFDPGEIYTLTLNSGGGLDGGGFITDLTIPEPSITALAGMALVIFLLRVRQINLRAAPVRVPVRRDNRTRR